MGHRLFNPLCFLLAIVVLYGGTEQRRAEAADGASPHRLLTTISVSKPSYPTVTTPMSAYTDPVSTPGTPYSSFPSLATGNGGGGTGGGAGGGGAGAGGGGAGGGGAGAGGGGGGGGGSWCVASPNASPTALQVALDYACGYGADCSAIQQGGSCFNPDTVHDHASYAFNSYYQKNPVQTSCDFAGTAVLTTANPSTSTCQYPATSTGGSVLNTSTPLTPGYGSPPGYGSSPPAGYGNSPPLYGNMSPPDYGDNISAGVRALHGRKTTAAAAALSLASTCLLTAALSLTVSG